ncbi:MAG: transposase [Microcystaceae cyanobacterium]
MMKYNPEYHHRRSIRLQGYDYSQTGIYFVTICAYQRQCLFGEIRNGKMSLNQIGKIVAQEWLKSAEIRQEIELDEWIIMPNHLHGIVVIDKKDDNFGVNYDRGANYDKDVNYDKGANYNKGASLAPLQRDKRKSKSLSSFIGGFKSSVTKRIKSICDHSNPVIWQRNYYEIIVRDENQLNQIRQYTINNPQKWDEDPEKPDNLLQEILIEFCF